MSLVNQVAESRGKVTANRLLALVRKMFNHGIFAERIEVNPTLGIRKFPERSRERFLQGDELPRFFKALGEFDNPLLADFWRVCLYTGARQANWMKIAVWNIIASRSR